MHLLIAGAVLLVLYLAVKAPDVNTADNKQSVLPNTAVPALGSVGNPSPAMAAGSPMISQTFRTAAAVNQPLVGSGAARVTAGTNVSALNVSRGTLFRPSATVAEMGKALMTVAPPTLVTPTNNPLRAPIVKL